MRVPAHSGPLQRAASRLGHALSLLWLISSAPTPFAATGPAPAALPEGGDPAAGQAVPSKEVSDANDS